MEFNQDSSLNPVLDEFSRDSRLSRSCGQLDSRLNSVLDDSLRDSRLISSCVQQEFLHGEKTQYGTLHRVYITGALVTLFHEVHTDSSAIFEHW